MENHKFWKYLKYTSHKIILDIVPHRRPKTSSRDSKENFDQGKLDKQLTGQASTSPFMSIREEASRRVSFDTREELGDKIDKSMVMIGKLATKDSNRNRPFKPQIHKSRGTPPPGQNRGYSQRNYQNKNRLSNRSDRGWSRQHRDRPKIIEGGVSEIIPEDTVDKIAGLP